MDTCRAAESSENQLADIRKSDVAVVAMHEMAASGSDSQVSRACFKCGGYGHIARNCPKNDESAQVQVREKQCFNCQGFGHVSSDCPTPTGDSRPQPRGGRRKSRGGRGRGGRARGGRARGGGIGRNRDTRELHELEDGEVEAYAQEFSTLSLHSLRISSLSDSSRKRYVKFRFHDLKAHRIYVTELKIDSGAEANVITLQKYREMFPQRLDAHGFPYKAM